LKAQELRDLNIEELLVKEKELGQELFNLRFQKATGQLSNTAAVGKIKKDLAKVKTVIQEIEMKGDPNRV
jgi:large subunit ribosomal protein L29